MDLADSLGFQLNRTARMMGQHLADALRPLELTPSQWAVLQFASQHPRCHQERLCRELDTDPATLTEVLGRLESRRLVERVADRVDRRRRLVSVTAAARPREGAELAQMVNEKATRGFSPQEVAELSTYLERIRDNLADVASSDPS